MQLKAMSVARLLDLREKVEAVLRTRIAGARSELESRLKKLSDFGSPGKITRRGPRGPVPPKYRNPDNPSETWTGRGRPPRWLAAEFKRGGRLEDFLIEGGATGRRKARKTKNARKVATPPKAAKRRKTGKPSKAKIARSPRATAQAPTPAPPPAPAEPSEAQTPTA